MEASDHKAALVEFNKLRERQGNITRRLLAMNNEREALIREEADINRQIVKLKALMDRASKKDLVVTEHAYLRFIERFIGISLKDIKDKMLSPETLSLINKLGDGEYPIGNGCRVVVKGNTVRTIKRVVKDNDTIEQ